DLAIRLGPAPTGDLVCTRLASTRYCVVASPGWRDRAGPLAGPGALSDHDCLRFTLPGFRSRWLFRAPDGAEVGVEVGGRILIANALALRRAAEAGLGPSLLADWLVAGALAEGRLVDLFPGHQATATTWDTAAWALYPARAYLPQKTRAAIDFLRPRL
ncbi:MAG: LysR substrate-binding domain-containing protein, partial [Pseudomonadota bacterium]